MAVKIGMVSLGCDKNRVDGEMMLATLAQAGYQLVDQAEQADVVVVNTCGFIDAAKEESIGEILELAKLKEQGSLKAIVVTGCLAERYRQEIRRELPEVDAVLGIGANASIAQAVEQTLSGQVVEEFPSKLCLPLNGERVQTTPSYYAYLKIADGCSNGCTYCAIPLIRGKYRSRSMEAIVAEAEQLASNGVKELILIAQDITRYGEDLYHELKLPELLHRLCRVEGIVWIRLLYCYPDRLTDELIETIAGEDKIVPYLDLPLQHCNGRVLSLMHRHGNREVLEALIQKIRAAVPGVVLRTTMLVGFPTESEEEFAELCSFVEQMHFERLGCFAYSQEENTKAGIMDGQLDEATKQHRQDLLMQKQMPIMEDYSREQVGKTLQVLYEYREEETGLCVGRSYADAPDVDGRVLFDSKGAVLVPGEFVPVLVTGFEECDLFGELYVQKR